jgi:hypothetical protein
MALRVVHALFLTFFLLSTYLPAAGAEIVDLTPVIKRGRILVSFRLTGAFTEDIERAIASGLPISFRYTVELKKVRTLWVNKRIAKREILTTVIYDNLTERYKLSREVDGELHGTEVVSDPVAMRRFMAEFEALDLFDVSLLEPNGEYYLRVKGVMKDRNLFLFIPWDIGSGWEKAYFTFLP